ncbi:Crp/Fnr family transcriptional regulator [Runella slithyformis]|uniref:Transcriptional regulator, Crp/Fnr family n=1 Tax=Runella slithyformis (strain ATCC 29530 / DSM 19594 / LMG 11500 / NCIMB 11436 / LSU 4) TaxID=761193 RepID=A0A7U3ZP24_RUNSL|nr:Crp/Fnr family transcriptional regulator [Runella slithyformis]AEI50752.1 putative transcriptional regulator, Crp/Fnr family [Runella slithyformis DSM 19594]
MEKLTHYFARIGFDGEALTDIVKAFRLQAFRKNELVVEEGKVSQYIGLVESGIFQYYVLMDGEERTTYVSIENTFLASLKSFISQTPSQENIRALTDGRIYVINRASLKQLVNDIPKFKEFYIDLLEKSLCGIDATRHDLIVLTGEQRYEKMLKEEPHLLQHIPLQYLASMLGVTPRHLSRIRNSIR